MRFLLDSSVSRSAYFFLKEAGHEVDCVRLWPGDPDDLIILRHAFAHRMILVTFDRDFGELIVRDGESSCGVIRLFDISATSQGNLSLLAAQTYSDLLAAGGIVTIEPGRVRVRE